MATPFQGKLINIPIMTQLARLINEAFDWQCNVLEYGDNVEVSLNDHIYSFYDKTAEEIIKAIKSEI